MNKKQVNFILVSIFTSLCIICGVAFLAINLSDDPKPTPPAVIDPSIIIANTSSAAQTQTAIVAPATSTPFAHQSPTFIIPTLASTWTPIPTDTPFILTLVTFPANNQPSQCICTEDVYNCGDPLEQTCFNYCRQNGYGDIHRLDQDGDGIACEDN